MAKKLLGRVEIKEVIEGRIATLPERYVECRSARVMAIEERDPAELGSNWTVQISAGSEVCRTQVEAIVRDVMKEFDCNLEVERIH